MSESVSVENKEQGHQKPPLTVGRIAGEILAGTAVGYALAQLVVYVLAAGSGGDCFGAGLLIATRTGFYYKGGILFVQVSPTCWAVLVLILVCA